MKQGQGLQFTFDKALISERQLVTAGKLLRPELKAMRAATTKGYADDRSSINLPFDTSMVRQVKTLAAKYRDVDLVIVVGIGGSNLGAMSVQEALRGRLYNETGKPRIYYADTVDERKMRDIALLLDDALQRRGRVLVNAVSKSGSTTETIANLEVFLATLKKHDVTSTSVVVTTDEHSPLWKLAAKSGFATLSIPKRVGGRYSVFSPAGLFPLAVLNIDVEELLAGAAVMRERCLSDDLMNNPAAVAAAIQYLHYKSGRNIAELFLFATDFESVGKWWRQLLGESCGKEFDRTGKRKIWAGITPTVSIGSTDLHSVAQLALGGPQDKLTTFVTVGEELGTRLPDLKEYDSLVPNLQGKSLKEIMDAILQGTMIAYGQGKRPYCHIALPSCSAYCLGQFLQLEMMETMFLAALVDVNPFDQPAVEAYKAETRRILATRRW
jgi:glucose-6-phosphate isomerase